MVLRASPQLRSTRRPEELWQDSDERERASVWSGLFGVSMCETGQPCAVHPACYTQWIPDEKEKSLESKLVAVMGCNRPGRVGTIQAVASQRSRCRIGSCELEFWSLALSFICNITWSRWVFKSLFFNWSHWSVPCTCTCWTKEDGRSQECTCIRY